MFSPLGDPSVVGKAPFARPRSVRLIRAKSQGAPQHPLRRHLMSHISCNSLQGGQISGSYHSNLSFSPTVKLNQSPAAHWTFCPPAAPLTTAKISGSYHTIATFPFRRHAIRLNQSPAAHWTFCPRGGPFARRKAFLLCLLVSFAQWEPNFI